MDSGTAENRLEIADLYSRYCHLIDHARYEDWLETFTDDGVFESPRFGRFAGREGLRKFTALYRDSLGGARVLHLVHNQIAKIESDTATGYCDFSYFHSKDSHIQSESVGYYTDLIRRTPAGWRFASRAVTILGSR
jgi:3-phenylpropionate/cinnamic acid dioxygenase small subunit